LKDQVIRADILYAADILEAKEAELHKRAAEIRSSVDLADQKVAALDAQIAHKKALIESLKNQALSAREALEAAQQEANTKIAKLDEEVVKYESDRDQSIIHLESVNQELQSSEDALGQLRSQIEDATANVLSLEDRIISLKTQSHAEQEANKTAIEELSVTISDLMEQRSELDRLVANGKETLHRINKRIELAETKAKVASTSIELDTNKLLANRRKLSEDIAFQESKLQSIMDEQTHRMAINISKEKELKIREEKLEEWAKELGYKERRIQSDLSLR
jgi:predicted  nucleic acid-binding Zn-ribbon protein